ncbi:hypothetical protein ACFL96_18660 [Thermoproteota archaeon]
MKSRFQLILLLLVTVLIALTTLGSANAIEKPQIKTPKHGQMVDSDDRIMITAVCPDLGANLDYITYEHSIGNTENWIENPNILKTFYKGKGLCEHNASSSLSDGIHHFRIKIIPKKGDPIYSDSVVIVKPRTGKISDEVFFVHPTPGQKLERRVRINVTGRYQGSNENINKVKIEHKRIGEHGWIRFDTRITFFNKQGDFYHNTPLSWSDGDYLLRLKVILKGDSTIFSKPIKVLL